MDLRMNHKDYNLWDINKDVFIKKTFTNRIKRFFVNSGEQFKKLIKYGKINSST